MPHYARIDVERVTPRSAPLYGTITHAERNGRHVLPGSDGILLIGPLGVNYRVEGSDNEVVFVRRADVLKPGRPGLDQVKMPDRARGDRGRGTYEGP